MSKEFIFRIFLAQFLKLAGDSFMVYAFGGTGASIFLFISENLTIVFIEEVVRATRCAYTSHQFSFLCLGGVEAEFIGAVHGVSVGAGFLGHCLSSSSTSCRDDLFGSLL
nr:hypothetical protein [uncultured Rothia sp.]